MQTSLQKVIRLLDKDLPSLLNDIREKAAEIIYHNALSLRATPGQRPGKELTYKDLQDSWSNPTISPIQEEERIWMKRDIKTLLDELFSNIRLAGNRVDLPESVDSNRSKRFVESGGVMQLVNSPHTVNFVDCFLGGFHLYHQDQPLSAAIAVKGSDILLTAFFMSIKQIQDMVKDVIERYLLQA